MDKVRPRKWIQLLVYASITSAALGVLISTAATYSPEVKSDLISSRLGPLFSRIIDLSNVVVSRGLAFYEVKGRTITLTVNESLELERMRITYRGLTGNGKFKIETIVPNFDREMPFRHEIDADAAKQGFRLYRDQFELVAVKADRLQLRYVSDYRQ